MNDNRFRDINIDNLLSTTRMPSGAIKVETISCVGAKRYMIMSVCEATKYLTKIRNVTFPDAIMIASLILHEYSKFGISRNNIKIGCDGVLVTDLFKTGDMTIFSTANSGDGFITVELQSQAHPRIEKCRFTASRSNSGIAQVCFRIWLWKNAQPGPTENELDISRQKIQDNNWVNTTIDDIDSCLNVYSSDLQISNIAKMKLDHAMLLFQGSILFILVPGRNNIHLSTIDRLTGMLIEEKMFHTTDGSKYFCERQNMIEYIVGFNMSNKYVKHGAHSTSDYRTAINKAFKLERKTSGKIRDKKLLDYGIRAITINGKTNITHVTKQHIATNWNGRNATIKIELDVPTDGAIKSLICIERSIELGQYIIYPVFNRFTEYAFRDVVPFDPMSKCGKELKKLINILNGKDG